MSKPPKIDRKTLREPDTFLQKGRSVLDWMASQKTRLLPLLALVLLVAGVIAAYDWWSRNHAERGWEAYVSAQKLPEPQKWEDLKSVELKWRGTRPAFFAAVALGDHFFDAAKKALEKPETADEGKTLATQAAEWYSRALESKSLLTAEKQLLYVNRGQAYEIAGQLDSAAGDFHLGAEFGGEGRPLALLNLARIHELKNDTARAIEVYEKLSTDFTGTEYAKIAKNHWRRLKSPLLSNARSS